MTRARHRAFSVVRIAFIAQNTLTELGRQKVFYLLLIFGLVLIGSSVFLARLSFQQEFQILKDTSLGAMSIFSSLLAIAATARLIPQDIEDRTVYTILAKPVPRFEYLLGKLVGVLLLLAISIAIMSALFVALLYAREQAALAEAAQQMCRQPQEELNGALEKIRSSSINIDIFLCVILVFIKAALLAALTLLVSTFASTSIFTTMMMVAVYFIGHLESTAREYWLSQQSTGWIATTFLAIVALIIPDLQAFNLVDDIVAGAAIPPAVFAQIALLGISYIVIYWLAATIAFYGKEL